MRDTREDADCANAKSEMPPLPLPLAVTLRRLTRLAAAADIGAVASACAAEALPALSAAAASLYPSRTLLMMTMARLSTAASSTSSVVVNRVVSISSVVYVCVRDAASEICGTGL
jgi:hypothetical protein